MQASEALCWRGPCSECWQMQNGWHSKTQVLVNEREWTAVRKPTWFHKVTTKVNVWKWSRYLMQSIGSFSNLDSNGDLLLGECFMLHSDQRNCTKFSQSQVTKFNCTHKCATVWWPLNSSDNNDRTQAEEDQYIFPVTAGVGAEPAAEAAEAPEHAAGRPAAGRPD